MAIVSFMNVFRVKILGDPNIFGLVSKIKKENTNPLENESIQDQFKRLIPDTISNYDVLA